MRLHYGMAARGRRSSGLRGGRVTVVLIDPASQVGLQQDVRVELRCTPHLLSALLDSHEASADPLDGLYRDQKVPIAYSQVPADRDVQKAHLPVDLVDQEVPHVADKVVVGVGDGTGSELMP